MNRIVAVALFPLLAVGCENFDDPSNFQYSPFADMDSDEDDDGLTYGEERDLGTNPYEADTDGDGLADADEVDIGTDPVNADTDGDGWADPLELEVGVDPATANDDLYDGGWPVQPDKSGAGDWSTAEIGAPIPSARFMDQHGQMVDIYDFVGHGKPILIDISAMWCGPCQSTAYFMTGAGSRGAVWDSLRNMVNDEEVYWLTIMGQNTQGGTMTLDNIQAWDENFPNENIPVLGDYSGEGDGAFWREVVALQYWPTFALVSPDGTWEMLPTPDGSVGTNQIIQHTVLNYGN